MGASAPLPDLFCLSDVPVLADLPLQPCTSSQGRRHRPAFFLSFRHQVLSALPKGQKGLGSGLPVALAAGPVPAITASSWTSRSGFPVPFSAFVLSSRLFFMSPYSKTADELLLPMKQNTNASGQPSRACVQLRLAVARQSRRIRVGASATHLLATGKLQPLPVGALIYS